MLTRFPEIENDKIDTKKFLLAADSIIDLIEKLGKVFSILASDMQNNVEKINSVYDMDKVVNKNLQDLLLNEKSRNENRAIEALLWLRRGLHFTLRFFELVEEDIKLNKKGESLCEYFNQAYKETLEPYHNWATKKLSKCFSRLTPTKTHLISLIVPDSNKMPVEEMNIFNTLMRNCIMNLIVFYEENNLDNL